MTESDNPETEPYGNRAILQIVAAMLSSITSMIPAHDISLGSLRLGIGNPLFLIAGPCVIENETHARKIAEESRRSPLTPPFLACYRS